MRIRNVKPEFYRSDDIDALTWEQRFLFIALFSYVDDNGVGRDRESDICADLFAGDFSAEPTETLRRVRQCLLALCCRGLVVRYEVENKPYLFVTGWDSHQYVKNPNKERYPRPDKELLQASVEAGESLGRDSVDDTPSLPTVVGSRSLVVGRKTPSSADADALFEAFWDLYPKKVEKQAARKKWDATVKRVDPETIMDGLRAYVAYWDRKGTERQFIKGPEVWLNKGCWADELDAEESSTESWFPGA